MSRIVQAANFVTPTSGGLRTALRHLAAGYAAAGHEVLQVLPGPADEDARTPWGRVVTLAAPPLARTGYRMLPGAGRVRRLLEEVAPDRLEVHDRTTLRSLGRWARRRGVPSVAVSHERLDRWLAQWLPGWLPLERAADRSNAALAAGFDAIVCTTDWAAGEFVRLGLSTLRRVPLGVDLETFHPARSAPAPGCDALLVLASRLSREKRPDLAVDTVRELVRRGRGVRLVVAGHGPRRAALERQAAGLPVRFVGHVAGRERFAGLLADADVVLAPGPVETFGLAALEALASGTPAVVNAASALPEVVGTAGRAAPGRPDALADAVESVLAEPLDRRRAAARARAEAFPWAATVTGFLAAHRLPVPAGAAA